MRRPWIVAGVAFLGLVTWSVFAHPWGWAYGLGVHPYPASSSTPWTYQLLSGLIPALTVVSLATFIVGAWHHVNCHQPGCLRIGKHKISGTPWCSLHQAQARPDATVEELLQEISDKLTELLKR